jgi:hypothetical protein
MDDKNHLKVLFEKKTETNGNFFFPHLNKCFIQNDKNELFISMPYDNTFYRLEAGEAYPIYTVDFGKYGMDNKYVGSMSTNQQMEYIKNMQGLASFPMLDINNSNIMSFSYFFKKSGYLYPEEKDIYQYIKINDKVHHVKKIRNDLTDFPDRLYLSPAHSNFSYESWHEDYRVDVIKTDLYFADDKKMSTRGKLYVEGLGEITSDEEIIVVLMKLKK